MNTSIDLYSSEELAGLRRKNRLCVFAMIGMGAAALAVCVLLCVLTRTANAKAMELETIAVSAVIGWIVLYIARFVVRRGRGEISHAQRMLTGERETLTGVVEVERETVRVPGGVTLCRVWVTEGNERRHISVNVRKAPQLAACNGSRLTLYAVDGFAAAFEPCGDAVPRENTFTGPRGRVRRFFQNILSRLHVYIVWFMLSALLWGWIFTLVTDAPRQKKVVVFAEAYGVEETALAAALESALPDGIRMVQAHLFSYAMFDDSELLDADIWIVRASDAAEWADSSAPLDTVPFDTGGAPLFVLDGTAYGVLIHDADGGAGSGLIQYDAPGAEAEDYYLFFNRSSPHTGGTDTAALPVAARLMEMETGP